MTNKMNLFDSQENNESVKEIVAIICKVGVSLGNTIQPVEVSLSTVEAISRIMQLEVYDIVRRRSMSQTAGGSTSLGATIDTSQIPGL